MNQADLEMGTTEALTEAENAESYAEADFILKKAMLIVLTEICRRIGLFDELLEELNQ